MNGRYTRWIEPDPERIKIWELAWKMLLSDKHSLEETCEELHSRGYHYRTGRPFIEVKKNGQRKANTNTMSRIFHNWFYAGWVVSEKAEIAPKTTRGQWKPLVTTEEFERGLEILAYRDQHRIAKRKHDYLLKSMVYIQMEGKSDLTRLTCLTSNANRPSGGTAYYCIPRSNVNIMCSIVDEQIPKELMKIQVNPDYIPMMQEAYTNDVAEQLGHLRPNQKQQIEYALKAIDDEEARVARLFATGKISEEIWDGLWADWQDRRRKLQMNMDALENKFEYHIANLDDALTIISKVGILYSKLERT